MIEQDLSNVVLLDNNPKAYSLQSRNGLSIIDFYGETDLDRELAMVSDFLKSCSNSRYCPDIRDAASQWQPLGVSECSSKIPCTLPSYHFPRLWILFLSNTVLQDSQCLHQVPSLSWLMISSHKIHSGFLIRTHGRSVGKWGNMLRIGMFDC